MDADSSAGQDEYTALVFRFGSQRATTSLIRLRRGCDGAAIFIYFNNIQCRADDKPMKGQWRGPP